MQSMVRHMVRRINVVIVMPYNVIDAYTAYMFMI